MQSLRHAPSPDEGSRRRAMLDELALGDASIGQALMALARLLQSRTGWTRATLALADTEPRWTTSDGPARPPTRRDFDLLALHEPQGLEIADTRIDPRCASAGMAIDAAHWPAYAGVALRVDGMALGTLSVVHAEPRRLDASASQSLRDLALAVEALLGARLDATRAQVLLSRGGDAILASSDWLWESDADGYMTWVSASAEQHTGEPAAVEIGRLGRDYNAAPGEPYQASYEAYLLARAARRPFKDAIAARQTPRGRLLVSMSGRPVFDVDGRFIGYRGAARDVTVDLARQQAAERERRDAESALRDKRAAEMASAAKSEFLSRMSHEMRTPLNAVIGFAQLLQMRSDAGQPVPVAQYSEHILQSGRHLLALVNDVLDLQQVETGRLNLTLEAVDLARSLDTAWQMIEPAARAHEIEITGRLDASVHVWADPRRLQQVLLNLLSNAVKYNRRGGWLRCSVEPPEATGADRVALLIEDAGEGLSAEQLTRLFQPFERLGRENSSVEGSGLGLVITRALVKEMGGSLTMSSEPGKGSRVRVELPRPPRDAALPHAMSALADATPAPLRMLYVEDNPVNALLFEEALKLRGGIDLRIVSDGPDAIELLRDWHPDVLVLDAHLPSMSGYEVLDRLRQEPRFATTPAFMCSADALPDELKRAHDAGFAGYWSKPIDIAQVIRALADLGAPGGDRAAMNYAPEPPFRHGIAQRTGVLLVNLGTPDAPTAPALRRYLAEFLSDPRVVEIPRALWLPLLHGVILRVRPARSAAKYATVWTPEGSPLAVWTRKQAERLGERLAARDPSIVVRHAMRYGNPSVASQLDALQADGATRVLVLPLYPQYAAATTASAFDAVFAWAAKARRLPELRMVNRYHDDPGYIDALATKIEWHWAEHGRGERLVLSFHGVPERSLHLGDPYHCECHKTARLLGERLALGAGQLVVTFQSRFGKAKWLEPYTEPTLIELARSGVRRVDVACPGFTSDCLETLEEIDQEARTAFLQAGGEQFRYIACLNDDPAWIAALADIAVRHMQGWPTQPEAPEALAAEAQRAQRMGAAA